MSNLELDIMNIISTSGESKRLAFEALKQVKKNNFSKARNLILESRKLDLEAHKIQSRLISDEINPDKESEPISLLMVHAQDHYMSCQLARDLIETLIEVFESKGGI